MRKKNRLLAVARALVDNVGTCALVDKEDLFSSLGSFMTTVHHHLVLSRVDGLPLLLDGHLRTLDLVISKHGEIEARLLQVLRGSQQSLTMLGTLRCVEQLCIVGLRSGLGGF